MSEQTPHNSEQEPERTWHRLSERPENLRDIKTNRLPDGRTREQWLNDEYPDRWRFNEAEFADQNSDQLRDSLSRHDIHTEAGQNQERTGRYESDEGVAIHGVSRYVGSIQRGYVEVTDQTLHQQEEE